PDRSRVGPVLAWAGGAERESLAMALSMLGLRVRVFDGAEEPLNARTLKGVLKTFDALIDAPLIPAELAAAAADKQVSVILEANASLPAGLEPDRLPPSRSTILAASDVRSWDVLCGVIGVAKPVEAFPVGAQREFRVFRDERPASRHGPAPRLRRD